MLMPSKRIVSTLIMAMSLAASAHSSGAAQTLRASSSTPVPSMIAAGAPADTTDEERIRTVFDQYRKAALERDGELASRTVDKKTLEAYQRYLELARTVDRAGLDALDLMATLVVLRLRHELDAAKLAAATGREIFALSVDQGWTSAEQVRNAEIAKVNVDRTSASVSLSQAPDVPLFFFVKEGVSWRFALWKTFAMVEPALQKMMSESGETDEVAFVVAVIESLSPRKFDRALLDGPPAGMPQSTETRP